MEKNTTHKLVFCAFFATLTAILSQFSIPIGPVPINLATFSVFLAGALLGSAAGALSQVVYVLLGACGLPVFAQFSGGIGVIAGPTGGYIIGYIAAAWLIGFLCERLGTKTLQMVFAMTAGLTLCYILGTAWFMFTTRTALLHSLMLCVFPFLIGDALKIAVAVALEPRLRQTLYRIGEVQD